MTDLSSSEQATQQLTLSHDQQQSAVHPSPPSLSSSYPLLNHSQQPARKQRNREASDATLDAVRNHQPLRDGSQTAIASAGVGSPDSVRTELAAFPSPRNSSGGGSRPGSVSQPLFGHGRSSSTSAAPSNVAGGSAFAFPSSSSVVEEEEQDHDRDWANLQRELQQGQRQVTRPDLQVDLLAASSCSNQPQTQRRRRSISPTDERGAEEEREFQQQRQGQGQYAQYPSTSTGGGAGDTTLFPTTGTTKEDRKASIGSAGASAGSPETGKTYTFSIHQQLRAQERQLQQQQENSSRQEGQDQEGEEGEEGEAPITASLGSFAASAGGAIAGFFGGLGRSASLSLRGGGVGAPIQQSPSSESPTAVEADEKMMETLPEGRTALIGPAPGHGHFATAAAAGKGYGGHGARGASAQISSASTARGTGERAQPVRKKTVAPPELLVIVRPPPSKQVHPLNLQVQLVTPQGPAPNSVGSNAGVGGAGGSLNARPSGDYASRASFESRRDSSVIVFPDDAPPPDTPGGGNRRLSTEAGGRRISNVSSADAPGLLNRSQSMSSTTSDVSGGGAHGASATVASHARVGSTTGGGGLGSARSLFSSWQQQRTRITPLYNLGFHSLLPTTITDAGTDQKVAKVSKKGVIDLEGFGQLEPRQLIIGVNDLATLQRASLSAAAANNSNNGTGAGPQPPTRTATLDTNTSGVSSLGGGTSSSAGVSSAAGVEPHPLAPGGALSGQEPPTSFEAMTPDAKAPVTTSTAIGEQPAAEDDKIGKKLLRSFKRLSLGPGPKTKDQPGSPAPSSILSPTASIFSRVGRGSMDAGAGIPANLSAAGGMEGSLAAKAASAGIEIPPMTPIERKPGQKRAEGYIWTMRKWARKIDEAREAEPNMSEPASATRRAVPTESAQVQRLDGRGAGQNEILSKVWKRFNLVNRVGGTEVHPDVAEIPVRFEWTLDTHRVHRRRATEEARAAAQAGLVDMPAGAGGSRSSLHGGASRSASRKSSANNPTRPNFGNRRSSHASSVSASEPPPRSPAGGATRALDSASASCASSFSEDAADRSRDDASSAGVRSGANALEEEDSDPEDSERLWTCHLVLGPQTKIPIATLVPAPHHPSIVGQLAIPFPLPDLSTSGLGQDGAGLTREELKDIIIVTVLHLVVRESFGGLGKKKPKK